MHADLPNLMVLQDNGSFVEDVSWTADSNSSAVSVSSTRGDVSSLLCFSNGQMQLSEFEWILVRLPVLHKVAYDVTHH